MTKQQDRMYKRILIGLLLFFAACCIVAIGYKTATIIEWETCRDRMATELDVSPTNEAVIYAWYDKLDPLLPPGTNRNDVITTLEQFAPVVTQNQGSTLDGGFVEMTSLQVCWFPANSIRFLLFYSKDGKLEEIRVDPSD